MCVLNWKCA